MKVDGEVRRQEILSKDEKALERIEREEIVSDRERKENKKVLNQNGMAVRMLSYLRAYCSMSQNFETFSTPDEGLFCVWCAKCAKYLAFGTFERVGECSKHIKLVSKRPILHQLYFKFYLCE